MRSMREVLAILGRSAVEPIAATSERPSVTRVLRAIVADLEADYTDAKRIEVNILSTGQATYRVTRVDEEVRPGGVVDLGESQ
jgi:hypothetical protein